MMQFCEMLKNERLRLGLTQDEVAKLCNISKRTYNYYEDGERPANSDFLMAFHGIGADINYLFTGNRSIDSLDSLERVALLAFNKLNKDGQKTSAITYMTMLEAGLVNGDFNSLWESKEKSLDNGAKNGEIVQNVSNNSRVGNLAGGKIHIQK